LTGGEKTLDASGLSCPVCGGSGRPFRSFGAFSLLRCSSCESLFYVPPPGEGKPGDDRPWESAKWYVERGANLFFYAEIVSLVQALLDARPGEGPGRPYRVLEAGGSYGFLIDIGRAAHGWEIAAADPAECARQGSLDLGIPLYGGRVEDAVFDAPFDAVIGVQLIEHLHDPFVFARALARILKDPGILLLTTPDATFDDLGPDYHPDEHVVIFSRKGLEEVLRSAGFSSFREYSLSLPQMLAVAAATGRLPEDGRGGGAPSSDLAAQVETYIRKRLAAKGLPDGLRAGLQFRLFEHLVNAGRYVEAEEWEEPLEMLMGRRAGQGAQDFLAGLVEKMTKTSGHGDYEVSGPGYAAPYLLYCGILNLNHRGRREEAAIILTLAERLFDHEIGRLGLTQYAPFLAAVRSALEAAGGTSP
jgi:SAM-dependent methyltransferase